MAERWNVYVGGVLVLLGLLGTALGILGVFRFRFVMNRMHCASVVDTLGLGLLLAGLVFLTWDLAYVPKLFAILAVWWVGSPIASHMVGRMELATDKTAREHMARSDEEELTDNMEDETGGRQ